MAPNILKMKPNICLLIMHACVLILISKDFDVMVTENMFGDILTDEGSVITSSMGMLPSASVGEHTSVLNHSSVPGTMRCREKIAVTVRHTNLFSCHDVLNMLSDCKEATLIRQA